MRGQPDYGMYAPKEVTASISDMGEVAARLGSIVTYDKRGDVVVFDNLEDPVLKWLPVAGAGTVQLSSQDVHSGSQALLLTTTAGIGDYISATKRVNVTRSKRVGLEISFGSVLAGYLWQKILFSDITGRYYAEVWIDFDNRLLYVWDGILLDYVLVGATGMFAFGMGYHFFYTTKVVLDFTTGKYVRILLGNNEWDISTIPTQPIPGAFAPNLLVEVGRENTDAFVRTTALDDFVYTQAEP